MRFVSFHHHFQIRKMEKDRLSFLEDKKCKHLKRTKIIEMLKTERNNLKDQLNSYEQGPFAKKTTEVFDTLI